MPRIFRVVDVQHPRQQFDLMAEEAHRDRSRQERWVLKNHFSKRQIGRVLAECDGLREVGSRSGVREPECLGNVQFGLGDGKRRHSRGVGPKCDLPRPVCRAPALKPGEADEIKNDGDDKGGGDMLENAFRAHSKILRLSGAGVKAEAGTAVL